MRFVEVDPATADYRRWYDAWRAGDRYGREETAATFTFDELRVHLARPSTQRVQTGWIGVVGGEGVVAGWIGLDQVDNRHRAELQVVVPPEQRRRGYGSAMLDQLTGRAVAAGRTVLGTEVPSPVGEHPTGPGVAFVTRHGWEQALVDVQRTLRLPVADQVLAVVPHPAYSLRSWTGDVPEEIVAEWVVLNAAVDTDAPTGDLDVEPVTPDVAAQREEEARRTAMGRDSLHTVAVDAAGELVAMTEILLPRLEPGVAYQWGTLVRPDHRGHGLGLAVKAANLRLLQATRPDIARVVTYNAAQNGPMVAVNDRLGFVPTELLVEFQKRL